MSEPAVDDKTTILSGTMNYFRTRNKMLVTPEMVRAGVAALERELLDGYSFEYWRPDLVKAVFRAMVRKMNRP